MNDNSTLNFADQDDLENFLLEEEQAEQGPTIELSESEDLEDEADDFGTAIDLEDEGLSGTTKEYKVEASLDFIAPDGSVSVMDTSYMENSFELIELPIENLIIAGVRIRKSPSVTSLIQSIKSTGLLSPIIVAPTMSQGVYVLVHGLKRVLACAKGGSSTIPAIVNKRIKSTEISIVEALYNQYTPYSMRECADYIKYLETEKGILSASMFEMLLQWNNGDYAKFKDVLDDGDPDITEKLFGGEFSIAQAFQALEKRRKKESREEKEIKTTEKAYSQVDENTEGLAGTGQEIDDEGPKLSEEEIKDLILDPTTLDDDIESANLDEMVEEGKSMEGFESHKQDWKNREIIDPAVRKAVMARDKNTCQCCKEGGEDMVDVLDLHHIVEVFLGGEDSVDNGLAICLNCHKQIHLYAYGQLSIPKTKTPDELDVDFKQDLIETNAKREKEGLPALTSAEESEYKEEFLTRYKLKQNKYKRIVKLGNVIREGMQKKGMKLEQAKKEHSIQGIGRQKPGVKNQRG